MRFAKSNVVCLTVLSVMITTARAFATSVVVQVMPDRVIVAADNRITESFGTPHEVRRSDRTCKVQDAGAALVSFTGAPALFAPTLGHAVEYWNVFDSLRRARSGGEDSAIGLEDRWERDAASHLASYLSNRPSAARDLTGGDPTHLIVAGLFAGREFGRPFASISYIYVYNGKIVAARKSVDVRSHVQALNQTTQELIDGKSQRAIQTAMRWKRLEMRIPRADRTWRYMQFLISETSKFESSVSATSDVAEVTASGIKWLSRSACR